MVMGGPLDDSYRESSRHQEVSPEQAQSPEYIQQKTKAINSQTRTGCLVVFVILVLFTCIGLGIQGAQPHDVYGATVQNGAYTFAGLMTVIAWIICAGLAIYFPIRGSSLKARLRQDAARAIAEIASPSPKDKKADDIASKVEEVLEYANNLKAEQIREYANNLAEDGNPEVAAREPTLGSDVKASGPDTASDVDRQKRGGREMSIHCIHCGTELPDIAQFCLVCGKPPRGASAPSAKPSPKVEYKQVHLDLSNGPVIEYPTLGTTFGSSDPGEPHGEQTYRQSTLAAQRLALTKLQPYFDEGWQLHGSLDAAIKIGWRPRGYINPKGRLHDATVNLVRYRN